MLRIRASYHLSLLTSGGENIAKPAPSSDPCPYRRRLWLVPARPVRCFIRDTARQTHPLRERIVADAAPDMSEA